MLKASQSKRLAALYVAMGALALAHSLPAEATPLPRVVEATWTHLDASDMHTVAAELANELTARAQESLALAGQLRLELSRNGGVIALTDLTVSSTEIVGTQPVSFNYLVAATYHGRTSVQSIATRSATSNARTKTRHEDRIGWRLRDECQKHFNEFVDAIPGARQHYYTGAHNLRGPIKKSPAHGWGQDYYDQACDMTVSWLNSLCVTPGIWDDCIYKTWHEGASFSVVISCNQPGPMRWNCGSTLHGNGTMADALFEVDRKQLHAMENVAAGMMYNHELQKLAGPMQPFLNDRIIGEVTPPGVRENATFDADMEAKLEVPSSISRCGKVFNTARGMRALLANEPAHTPQQCRHPGVAPPARLTPFLGFFLQWSNDPICWPSGVTDQIALSVRHRNGALGAVHTGDRFHAFTLPDDWQNLCNVSDSGDSVAYALPYHFSDNSAQLLPSGQPIPTKCFFAPSGSRLAFESNQVNAHRDYLRKHAELHGRAVSASVAAAWRLFERLAAEATKKRYGERTGVCGSHRPCSERHPRARFARSTGDDVLPGLK